MRRGAKSPKPEDWEDTYRTLVENSLQGLVIFQDGRVVLANSAVSDLLGYTHDEMLAFSAEEQADLIHSDDRERVLERMQRRLTGEPLPRTGEFRLLHRTGSTVWVQALARRIEFRGRPAIQSVYLDVTEEVEARERLRRTTRALTALWHCNEALQRADEETEMLQQACHCLVKDSGYTLAWVGYAEDDPEKTIRPVAESGFERGYPGAITVRWGDDEYAGGPSGKAVRNGTPSICHDTMTDPEFEPWREQARRYGYRSSIALPLKTDDRVFGVLSLYASAPDAFDEEEARLLERLAADLSYGILGMRRRNTLRESEERYRVLVEASPDAIAQTDLDGRIVAANRQMAGIHGYEEAQDLIGKDAVDLFAEEERQHARVTMEKVLESGGIRDVAHTLLRADGTRIPGELSASVIRDSSARPIGLMAIIRDVTEHKKAQDALAESELKYRTLVETASEGIAVIKDGRLVFVNPATSVLAGVSSEELLARPFINFVHPDDRSMVLERHQARMRGEEVPSVYVFRVARGDGAIRCAEVKAVRVDWQGEPATLNLLSDITERRQAELERERLLREQVAVSQLALALGETLDLGEIYQRLYDRVRTLIDAEGFIVSSYDPENKLIRAEFLISEGIRHDTSGFPLIPLEEEGCGTQSRVIRTGEPLYLPDFREAMTQTRSQYTFDEKGSVVEGPPPPGAEETSTNSALLVPLRVAGKTIGVLQLQSNQRDAYTEEAKNLLCGLANVAAVAIQNAQLYRTIEKALETTIQTLGLTTETRDPYTAGHQRRVADLACAIAKEMHAEEQSIRGIRAASLVHDIGKLSIPAEILSRPSALTPLEFGLVKAHPQTAYDILKGIVFPWPVVEMVLQHHERLDGSGYPQGLRGNAILLGARILAVADVVEAMASHRPYRPALGVDKALAELEAGAGVLYDSEVVGACRQLFQAGYSLSSPPSEAQ